MSGFRSTVLATFGVAAACLLLTTTCAATTGTEAATWAHAANTTNPQGAKITFKRVFVGSSPELIQLSVREDSNAATYEIRQLEEDPEPLPFEVGEGLRSKIFSLAAELHHFEGQDLDVHRKIANLGEKTFRWEQGTVWHETKFNYTLNQTASQLLQIFEGLARQQEHFALIARRMKYDRLGINDALLQFESDLNRGLMPEPQRLLPLLDQISSDPKFVDIARQRARTLGERLRGRVR